MFHFVSLLRVSCGLVRPRTASQNLKHFLLRGSTVRNTHHVIGLVVHLGIPWPHRCISPICGLHGKHMQNCTSRTGGPISDLAQRCPKDTLDFKQKRGMRILEK